MSDGTAIHIDFAVRKSCWNLEASAYDNCYGCGYCAKDKKQRYENRIRYLNGMIEEQENFDNWFDEPEMRALQEKNRQANIEYFKKKLAYYTKKLKKLGGLNRAEGGRLNMWEDQYQVYRRYGDNDYDLRASDMTIDDAVIFIKAVFQESYSEPDLRFEIRRQPKEEDE